MGNKRIMQIMENLRGNKEFFGWIIAIVIATILSMAWLSSNFVTIARGEEMMGKVMAEDEQLSSQISILANEVKQSNGLLLLHIKKEELEKIMTSIKVNESEVYSIQQFITVNGTNRQAEQRLRQLKSEHDDLIIQRDCKISGNTICD